MSDNYSKLLKRIGAPEETSVEELAQHISDESDAIVDLAGECNRLVNWLSYICRNSRGKAREWASEALGSEDGPERER